MKTEIIGIVKEIEQDMWAFDTGTHHFTANVPTAIDELLNINSKDGDKFKIIIEKL